jgi:hypothetical protein
MAYKVFSNGDALTGGELNTYLMNQSVMVFASATARTAALPSPSEGMVTYLEDTNVLYLWTGASWQSIVSVVGTGNILINSNFLINQRTYTSGTSLSSGAYGLDRWKATSNNSSMTFTYSANGFPVTINSGGSFAQVVEQFNIPGSGSYTLSWSGTATGRVYNSGATAPSYAASPVTVTLDGTANVVVEFEASGGTKTLEKVQLEKGTSATNWRLQSNGFEAELAKCQRYYWRIDSVSSAYALFSNFGSAFNATTVYLGVDNPSFMRTKPSAIEYGNLSLTDGAGGFYSITSATIDSASSTLKTGGITVAVASGLTTYRPYRIQANNSTSAYLAFTAEL